MIEVKKTKLEGIKYYYLYVFDSQKMPLELRKRCYALKDKKKEGIKFVAEDLLEMLKAIPELQDKKKKWTLLFTPCATPENEEFRWGGLIKEINKKLAKTLPNIEIDLLSLCCKGRRKPRRLMHNRADSVTMKCIKFDKKKISKKNIILFDDCVVTGFTLVNLHAKLKELGASEILPIFWFKHYKLKTKYIEPKA